MEVTLYLRPTGRTRVIDITKVLPDDEQWFKDHSAKISMEETGDSIIAYADVGLKCEDGEPDELIVIAPFSKPCETMMSELRAECEKALAK